MHAICCFFVIVVVVEAKHVLLLLLLFSEYMSLALLTHQKKNGFVLFENHQIVRKKQRIFLNRFIASDGQSNVSSRFIVSFHSVKRFAFRHVVRRNKQRTMIVAAASPLSLSLNDSNVKWINGLHCAVCSCFWNHFPYRAIGVRIAHFVRLFRNLHCFLGARKSSEAKDTVGIGQQHSNQVK